VLGAAALVIAAKAFSTSK